MKLLLSATLCAAMLGVAALANPAPPPPGSTPSNALNFGLHDCDPTDTACLVGVFERWALHHGYNVSDTMFTNFLPNALKVIRNNAAHAAGTSSWRMGLNQFAHMNSTEFRAKKLGRLAETGRGAPNNKMNGHKSKRQLLGHRNWGGFGTPSGDQQPETPPPPQTAAPLVASRSLNWVNNGLVTPVKDQGECGCCWAFACTGCVEGAYAKATNTLVSFSEEQLVECVDTVSQGCGGGRETDGYHYAQRNGGLETETSYPYTSEYDKYGACSSSASNRVKVSFSLEYSQVVQSDADLLAALIAYGPIDVAIGVADIFQLYSSGIMGTEACLSEGYVNHAAILVGYNIGPDGNYWILKNSWGTSWGEDGYFLFSMGTTNICSINIQANACIVSI